MKKIHHIVLVQFDAGKAHRMVELTAALDNLRKKLRGFVYLSGGPYSSPRRSE